MSKYPYWLPTINPIKSPVAYPVTSKSRLIWRSHDTDDNEYDVAEQGLLEAYKSKNMKYCNLLASTKHYVQYSDITNYIELKCNCSYDAKV